MPVSSRRFRARPVLGAAAASLTALGAAACSSLLGLGDKEIVDCLVCDGGAEDAPSGDANTADGDGACPSGRGPAMARVGDFCIDTTEVTNAQYVPFLDAVVADPKAAQQPAGLCNWNTDFHVWSNYPQPGTGDPSDPVRGVDPRTEARPLIRTSRRLRISGIQRVRRTGNTRTATVRHSARGRATETAPERATSPMSWRLRAAIRRIPHFLLSTI